MDKVYKDVNNLEALLISCDTRGNASQKKGLVPWKDLFDDSHKMFPGAVFIVKGTIPRCKYFGPV